MADQPKASEVNINDEREVRRAKRQSLIDAGVNPYPVKSKVTAHAAEIDERYAGLAQEVCRKLNLPCANLFPELMARGFAGLLTDGIHPGPEGNELFASLLMDRPETVTFLNAE